MKRLSDAGSLRFPDDEVWFDTLEFTSFAAYHGNVRYVITIPALALQDAFGARSASVDEMQRVFTESQERIHTVVRQRFAFHPGNLILGALDLMANDREAQSQDPRGRKSDELEKLRLTHERLKLAYQVAHDAELRTRR